MSIRKQRINHGIQWEAIEIVATFTAHRNLAQLQIKTSFMFDSQQAFLTSYTKTNTKNPKSQTFLEGNKGDWFLASRAMG